MLKSKIAMALAAAMVMAALYGCSSSSDSGLKDDVAALKGTVDKVADALGLDAGASEEAILAALEAATDTQLADIRTELVLEADATPSMIVNAIQALRQDQVVALTADELKTPAIVHNMEVVRAIRDADADGNVNDMSTRPDGTDADLDVGFVADIAIDAYSRKVSIGSTANMDVVPASDADAPSAGAVWAGSAFLKDVKATTAPAAVMPAKKFQAFVYTNIEAPEDAAYATYYMADTAPEEGTPGSVAVARVDDADDDDNRRVLTLTTSSEDISADADLFNAARFPQARNQTLTFTDDTETEDVKENEVEGSFQGVLGTYTCTESCTVTSGDDAKVMSLTGVWTFTPDEVAEGADAHMVLGVTADPEYAYFGYWLQVFTDAEGVETIGVNTFASGNGDAVEYTSVEGEADYSGKAGGKYAVKTLTAQGDLASLHSGQFTADVNLSVTFGGNDVAVSKHDMISGDVTGFQDSAGDHERIAHWTDKVELMESTLAAVAADGDGGATTGGGVWSATFYGAGAMDTDLPAAVVGTFDAHLPDGHLIGAYGADKVDAE